MDFRYLVETKNEFNNFMNGILVPHIFHGIKGMFKYSTNVFDQIEQKNKRGSKINNPGINQIFKKTLDGIKELNNHEIEEEYQRIKIKSGCIDFFDNLIKASFKSYVLLLTWDPKIEESKYTDNKLYDKLSIKDFIHKCYIISCEYFREYPEIFVGNKSNKKDILEIIKNCIELSIKKSLPYNEIIEEYLQIDYTKKDNKYSKELSNVKNLVYEMINNNKYGNKPVVKNLINEYSEEFVNVNEVNIDKKHEIQDFIKNQIINENRKESLLETSNIKADVVVSEYNNSSNNNISNNNLLNNSEKNNRKDFINDLTSSVVTRTSIKTKEINNLIDNSSINNDYLSSTSDNKSNLSKSQVYKTNSQSIEIINSPPALRAKINDRLNELQLPDKDNIKVNIKSRKNISNKFSKLDSYFDSMIK